MAQVALTKSCLLSSFLILLILWTKKSSAGIKLVPSSMYAIKDQNLTLNCFITNTSQIIVWRRNGTDITYVKINGSTCSTLDGGSGLTVNYTYICTDNKTYNLVIPRERIRQEIGLKWQCKYADGSLSSKNITLKMATAPTSDPVVTGYNGTILYSGSNTKLTCSVQGGTPLATLSWTCGGSNITDTEKNSTTAALSEITLNINSSYNGKRCVCTAEHLLWDAKKKEESQIFLVYYPPTTNPVVSGYDGRFRYEGDIVTLSCTVSGGSPPATLSWTCNGQQQAATRQFTSGTAVTSNITVTIKKELNEKMCTCHGRHPDSRYSPNVTSDPFIVHYVSSELPVLTGYTSGQPINTSYKELECKVYGGFPLAIVTMTCNNKVINGTNQSTPTESKYKYTIYVDKTYNKQQCICNGRHPDQNIDYNINTNVTFNVYFAPDTGPVINGYKQNEIIYETEHRNLSCRVIGGNPVATIKWRCRGFVESAINQSVNGEARSTITLNIDREYNNKQCICEAVHPADSYNRQTNVTFTVYYPPSSPIVVNNITTFPWKEGRYGLLSCLSTPGNPSSSFQWKADGIIISGERNQVIEFTKLTKEYNMKQYSCQVFNNFTTNKGQQMWSLNVSLNVEYSPVISVGKTPVNVTEGKKFERECSADGNPKPLINWIYGNHKSAILQFVNTNRNQTGNYTCEAIGNSSKYGELKSQKDLTVIVQFPPTVNVLLSSSIEGQTTEIECTAEGVPDKYYYTKWTQMYGDNVIRTGLFGSLSLENSCLTLTDVSYQDIGVYQCTVHNTIKDRNEILEQYGSAYLDIKFPPVFMPNSPHNYYAELDHRVEIGIPFFSNPFFDNTSIAIIKSDKNYLDLEGEEFSLLINTSSLNLLFHGKNLNVNGKNAIFVINSFQEHHKGPYSIFFTTVNGLTSSFGFEIIPSGHPGQPKKITVLSNTTTSITIAWSREFNGGYPQTFVILFKPLNSKEVPMEAHIKENDEQDYYNYTLTNLDPGTEYLIWIYSFNYKGNSTESYDAIEPLKSKTKPERTNGSILNLLIGIAVAIIVIVVIIVAVICLFRRYKRKGEDGKLINNTSNRQSLNDQNSEDGMRDNVLYEPAGPNYINPKTIQAKADPSAADIGRKSNDIYSEVRKPGKRQNGRKNTELYAKVDKKLKSTTPLSVNSSDIYSEVNKTRKYDAGKVYENMETSFNTQESHAKTDDNPRQHDKCKQKQEKPQKLPKPAPQKRNKDGLIYIDLILDEPTMDGKQFVIRGLENKTDYAEVDFGRKADPFPPGQDENYDI